LAHSSPSTNNAKAGGKIGRHDLLTWKLRPCTVGFLTLAFTVFLWTTAYKLSLYHVNRDHCARVSAARLWLDPRSARTQGSALGRVTTERRPNPSNLSAFGHQMHLVDLGPMEQALPRLPFPASIVPLVPSRAPPARRFCLA